MATRIFNREYSAECLPGGSTICDGVTDLCECPCHEESGTYRDEKYNEHQFADVVTVGGMQQAHALFWKDVPLSETELRENLTSRF